MKFKSLTKLAMSGVALAAVATTLGASTYAWYVTNSKATASNIEASTRDNDGSNLLVSKDGSNFSSKVVFNTDDAAYLNRGVLDPVTTTDTTSFIEYDENQSSTTSSKYVQVEYWLKSSENVTCKTTLAVENNTTTLPVQKVYFQTGGVTTNTISVDAVTALRTSFKVDDAAAVIYQTDAVAKQADFETAYAVKAGSFTSVASATVQIDDEDGGDTAYTATGAHAYYGAVMRMAAPKESDSSVTTPIANISLTADTAVHVVMTIWLEGSDTLCFDACGGQQFTFALQFTKTA